MFVCACCDGFIREEINLCVPWESIAVAVGMLVVRENMFFASSLSALVYLRRYSPWF